MPKSSASLTKTLAAVGAASLVLLGARILTNFLGTGQSLGIHPDPTLPLDSPAFLQFLSVITNGAIRPARITRLRNGSEFYPAELAAIRSAQRSINLEFYEFLDGQITREFVAALTERASAGVEVRVLIDALGSASNPRSLFRAFKAAGGHMRWYHPLGLRTWPDFNNRTHRKVIVVDACTGFMGGAGVADHWLRSTPREPAWRDTMFRVEGPAVLGLLSTFSENWTEASGEILSGPRQFHDLPADPSGAPSFVVLSTPKGGATQNHILFQALIQSARHSIHITTPYFLPDRSVRAALAAASRRGVDLQIVVAGPRIDHPFIRRLSHASSRHLLNAGARIFEYQPAMIHAKLMTIDDQWCILGSTNFDHRSFALNDEVNLAVLDLTLAKTLESDFQQDLRDSLPLTLASLPSARTLSVVTSALDHIAEQAG